MLMLYVYACINVHMYYVYIKKKLTHFRIHFFENKSTLNWTPKLKGNQQQQMWKRKIYEKFVAEGGATQSIVYQHPKHYYPPSIHQHHNKLRNS